jgi:hypothetical protein
VYINKQIAGKEISKNTGIGPTKALKIYGTTNIIRNYFVELLQ